MSKNMLIGQSGGPTVAINASLSGAVKKAMTCRQIGEIFGAINGLEGVIKERIINLRNSLKSQKDFVLLSSTPGMALGSCRFKLADKPNETYKKILDVFKKYNIGYFFYIGGNDSMDSVKKLSAYFASLNEDIKVVGIPKTIDNDLKFIDHTPGFGSAAKFIATSISEIACDSSVYDLPSVTIVEIMGRNAGWLTASAALARHEGCNAPQLIYLPEIPFNEEDFLSRVKEIQVAETSVVVAVSEGIRFADGRYVCESICSENFDAFGHKYLCGTGKYLEMLVRKNLGCKVRSIELSVLQRAACYLNSGVDIEEASKVGEAAVRFAVKGQTGIMATIKRVTNHPYLVSYESVDIDKVANFERKVPIEWISKDGCDVTKEMIEYLKPLVLGKQNIVTVDGIPSFFTFDKTLVKN